MSGAGKKRILFVDDEDFVVKAARFMFMDLGYDVEVFCDAGQALNTFRSGPDAFDVVVTDHLMPDMSGMDLAREVIRIRPGLPVILCTGIGSSVSRDEAFAAGVFDVLSKPFNLGSLSAAIEKATA